MLDAPALEPLGLSLLHFLWQGGLVGVGLWLLLKTVAKADHRYMVACLGLVVLVALPVTTYVHLQTDRPATQVASPPVAAEVAPVPAQTSSATSFVQPDISSLRRARTVSLKPYLPYFVLVWFVGVLGTSLNLPGRYVALGRLRTRYMRPVSAQVQS